MEATRCWYTRSTATRKVHTWEEHSQSTFQNQIDPFLLVEGSGSPCEQVELGIAGNLDTAFKRRRGGGGGGEGYVKSKKC